VKRIRIRAQIGLSFGYLLFGIDVRQYPECNTNTFGEIPKREVKSYLIHNTIFQLIS